MKKMFLTFAAALVMVAVSAQPQGGQGGFPGGGQMPEGFQKMMESMQKIQTERNASLKALMTGDQVAKFDTWAEQQSQRGMMGRGPQGQGGPQGQRPQGAPQGQMPQRPQGAPQGQMPQRPQGAPQGGPQGGMRGGMNSEAMIQFQVESLNQAVTLTDDQKTKATAIFQDAAKKQQELMSQMRPQGAPQQ